MIVQNLAVQRGQWLSFLCWYVVCEMEKRICPVVICIWCALFVTSQFDVISMFPNQRFGEVC